MFPALLEYQGGIRATFNHSSASATIILLGSLISHCLTIEEGWYLFLSGLGASGLLRDQEWAPAFAKSPLAKQELDECPAAWMTAAFSGEND